MFVSLNGRIIYEEDARVSIYDRGFLFGDGLFETMRAYNGRVFRLKGHLERLYKSCDTLKIPLRRLFKPDETGDRIYSLLEKNGLLDAYVRMTVSRGMHTGVLTLEMPAQPTFTVITRPLHLYPAEYYKEGATAVFAGGRVDPSHPLVRHKSTSYLSYILAREEAREKGALEAIILNTRGEVAEGATSNIFIVRGDEVITPPEGAPILPGITRSVITEIIELKNRTLYERPIGLEELIQADEAFLTNSLMEVMPLVRIEGNVIGNGRPGPYTTGIMKEYKEIVERETGG